MKQKILYFLMVFMMAVTSIFTAEAQKRWMCQSLLNLTMT